MANKHYAVSIKEIGEPKGMATACPRGCMCCGVLLTGMGGPGDFLCEVCMSMIRSGEMMAAISSHRRRLAEAKEVDRNGK